MEAILQRLATLSTDELRAEVKSSGQKVLPITQTTRRLVERRLAKCLWQRQGGGDGDGENSESPAPPEARGEVEERTVGDRVPEQAGGPQADVDSTGRDQPSSEARSGPAEDVHYFAVCLPGKVEAGLGSRDEPDSASTSRGPSEVVIFQSKKVALSFAKKNKGARFKVFKTQDDATHFAKSNQDLSTPKPNTEPPTSQPPVAEKPVSNFRSVKQPDLVRLRKAIEENDTDRFSELVWSNPRYLINAGDTPTILQEGCRYNALHFAAKGNRVEVGRLLLETLEDAAFILLMYPEDPEETVSNRTGFLVDLYLNSPEKGNGETSLHFASKFGNFEMTELLVSHPRCDKMLENTNGETAIQIACTRSNATGQELKNLETSIVNLLQDHYYVPLYRSDDNCTQPVIGQPWSPDLSGQRSHCLFDYSSAVKNPVDPVLSMQAFAGPMSPNEAESFRRSLLTPPSGERKRVGQIKRADGEKGMERIGRDVASKMGVSWAEYWGFLDTFVDLSSPRGLQRLEDYLAKRYNMTDEDETELRLPEPSRNLDLKWPLMDDESGIRNLVCHFQKMETGGDRTDNEHPIRREDSGVQTAEGIISKEPPPVKEVGSCAAAKCNTETESPSTDSTVIQANPAERRSGQSIAIQRETETGDGSSAQRQIALCKENGLHDSVGVLTPSLLTDSLPRQRPAESESGAVRAAGERSDSPDAAAVENAAASEALAEVQNPPGCSDAAPTSGEVGNSGAPDACAVPAQGSRSDGDDTSPLAGRAHDPEGSRLPPGVDASPLQPDPHQERGGLRRSSTEADAEVFATPKMPSSQRTGRRFGRQKMGYILGSQPSKMDLHVWRALGGVVVPDRYRCIQSWKELVRSVSAEIRERWPTPARCLLPGVSHRYASQTPSPRHRGGLDGLLEGSPLGLRARHFSEPVHRAGRGLARAGSDDHTRSRLFQE